MLRERSGSPRPWLFYRDGIDWQWLSHRRAAIQLMRTAEALGSASAAAEPVPIRPGFDVETLVVGMAARLSGVPVQPEEDHAAAFAPPPPPAQFETLQVPALGSPLLAFAQAHRVEALLRGVRPARDERGGRPVVFAAPEPDVLEILAAATLALDAGWALEPMAEAFVATARWVRPTILVAPPPALGALAEVWEDADRRWSRLRTVVVRSTSAAGLPENELRHWRHLFGRQVQPWIDVT